MNKTQAKPTATRKINELGIVGSKTIIGVRSESQIKAADYRPVPDSDVDQ
jgi:hypothetical protein